MSRNPTVEGREHFSSLSFCKIVAKFKNLNISKNKKQNNDGVFHFGFDKNELENGLKNLGFKIIDYKKVYTDFSEDREFPIFNLIAQK